MSEGKAEILMRYVLPVPESGCWLWDGTWHKDGYGLFHIGGKRFRAHRVSYELFKGPIPEGLQIDHLCRVRCCVNPDHLDAVSSRDNTIRGISPPAILAKKMFCKRGHPLFGDNCKRVGARQERYCKTCNRARMKARYYAALTPQAGKGGGNG